jgi:iron complex transport system substrate-binding protein
VSYPHRIVCLTEETTETLYLLGEGERVVGVSGYTVRPPEARRKPRVSAYLTANIDKIEALDPDLVLAFSDLQAGIVHDLVRRGRTVVTFNQRSIAEILQMIRLVGGLIGCSTKADALVAELDAGLDRIRAATAQLPRRPRVYFEEWDTPLISGIRWVEKLVELAGGTPIFPELRSAGLGRDRIVSPEDVIARDPEVIVASWCGKKVRPQAIATRPGWDQITAVRRGRIHEIKSSLILQPGPAALTDGVRLLQVLIRDAVAPAGPAGPQTF